MSNISPAALSLAGLAIEYCKIVAQSREKEPRQFVRDVLRYLPRIYITICDLRPYEEDEETEAEETGAIYDTITEEQYNGVMMDMSVVLGENDMYLDTPADEMRYSDTPIAVSLSEKLADIYQAMADFAATVGQVTPEMIPDVLADLKYRFASYLSETICSALRAANYIYHNVSFDQE